MNEDTLKPADAPDTCETCYFVIPPDHVLKKVYECDNVASQFCGQPVGYNFCCPWRKQKEKGCHE